MRKSKLLAIVTASLVAGLVMGNLGSAFAARRTTTRASSTVASTVASCGLGIGRTMRDAGGRLIDIVASMTGKSVTDIQTQRAAGKSFSAIAAQSDVSAADVVAKALEVRKTALADAVKAGTITQAQADTALATMKTRLTSQVDQTGTGSQSCAGMGGGRGNGAGGRGSCGMGGNCASTVQ